MEQEFNPYATGQAHQVHVDSSADLAVTPAAVTAILKTQVWVKLIGIVMCIIAGVVALRSILNVYDFRGQSSDAAYQVGFGVGMLIGVGIVAGVFILMAVRLLRYSSAIKKLSRSKSSADLSLVMQHQARFWKSAGVVLIVIISFYIIAIIAGL